MGRWGRKKKKRENKDDFKVDGLQRCINHLLRRRKLGGAGCRLLWGIWSSDLTTVSHLLDTQVEMVLGVGTWSGGERSGQGVRSE